jgi:hypothetical protein
VNPKPFLYHVPGKTAQERIEKIRQATIEYARVIDDLAPTSREKSVAVTNLETTQMWAIKAVVVNDPEAVVKS